MIRKLIVLTVLASFALMPAGASAGHAAHFQAHASGDAESNLYFYGSETCSTDAEAYSWARQGGGEFTTRGEITPEEGFGFQEVDVFGSEATGTVYFQNEAETEAFSFEFEGYLRCLSETEGMIAGTWTYGYLGLFDGGDGVCTELDARGRVLIHVNFATQETSTYLQGYYTEGASAPCD